MPETEKRKQYKTEHDQRKYDHIHFRAPKGTRQTITDHAASRGKSLNGFVNRVVSETIEREKV